MSKYNKSRIKPHDGLRAVAIKYVAKKFQVTDGYVRMSILGTTTNGRSEEVRNLFREKYAELQKVIS